MANTGLFVHYLRFDFAFIIPILVMDAIATFIMVAINEQQTSCAVDMQVRNHTCLPTCNHGTNLVRTVLPPRPWMGHMCLVRNARKASKFVHCKLCHFKQFGVFVEFVLAS